MECAHGNMVKRSGEKDGKPWSGYFCPLPQERKSEQCSPKWEKTSPRGNSAPNTRSQDISKAQDKKEESIAFFNATNSAISVCVANSQVTEDDIRKWRNWFYQEWKNHSAPQGQRATDQLLNKDEINPDDIPF